MREKKCSTTGCSEAGTYDSTSVRAALSSTATAVRDSTAVLRSCSPQRLPSQHDTTLVNAQAGGMHAYALHGVHGQARVHKCGCHGKWLLRLPAHDWSGPEVATLRHMYGSRAACIPAPGGLRPPKSAGAGVGGLASGAGMPLRSLSCCMSSLPPARHA